MPFSERQLSIINAAISLIARKGIQEMTIKNLAEEVGVSEAALYRHFPGKTDILLAILNSFESHIHSLLTHIENRDLTSLEKIRTLFQIHFKQFKQDPAITAVLFSEEIFQNEKLLADKVLSIMELNQKKILGWILAGQEENQIRKDIPASHLTIFLMGPLRLLIKKWRLTDYSFSIEEEGMKLWESLEKILAG
jgi:AcrR family transcriptional regulator